MMIDLNRLLNAYIELKHEADLLVTVGEGSQAEILDRIRDFFIAIDEESEIAAMMVCPHGEPMHFHHDGCPSCIEDDTQEPSPFPGGRAAFFKASRSEPSADDGDGNDDACKVNGCTGRASTICLAQSGMTVCRTPICEAHTWRERETGVVRCPTCKPEALPVAW
jgi:hypothetical protein